jgi:hypothetical protein
MARVPFGGGYAAPRAPGLRACGDLTGALPATECGAPEPFGQTPRHRRFDDLERMHHPPVRTRGSATALRHPSSLGANSRRFGSLLRNLCLLCFIIVAGVQLAGCGQKGDLYLPEAKPSVVRP